MALKFIRQMKAFNRRHSGRLYISCLAKYDAEVGGKKENALTNLINISEGGALIVTFHKKLAPKTLMDLQFQLPNMNKAISVQGEVARTYERRKGIYQAGIQFKNLKADDLQKIKEFIGKRLPSKKRSS